MLKKTFRSGVSFARLFACLSENIGLALNRYVLLISKKSNSDFHYKIENIISRQKLFLPGIIIFILEGKTLLNKNAAKTSKGTFRKKRISIVNNPWLVNFEGSGTTIVQ